MTRMLTALKEAGIEVTEVVHPDECEEQDGEIKLTHGFGVQIGEGYYILTREEGDGDDWGVTHFRARRTPEKIISDFLMEHGKINDVT